ncbi:MAG: hypothetical protein KatS3mg054_0355 [Chloroflexus sp.]|nr:MAG: hypothetical protein KatS3mg054_0355 [Chloroflexus sp.]
MQPGGYIVITLYISVDNATLYTNTTPVATLYIVRYTICTVLQ